MIRRLRIDALALALAVLALSPLHAATKRQLAAEQFRKAEQLLEDLRAVPEAELGAHQYDLVSRAFREVHRLTPASSYCDDALYHAAEVLSMKAARFESSKIRAEAVQAYRYLVSQYPHSKLLGQAREQVAMLESGAAPRRAPDRVRDVEDDDNPAVLAQADEPPVAQPKAARPAPAQTRQAQPAPAPAAEATVVLASTAQPAAGDQERKTLPRLANRAQPSPDRQSQGLAGVKDIRHWTRPDGTRIVLELDDYVPYKFDFLQRPNRLYFDLFTSRLTGDIIQGASYDVGEGAVARIRLGQNRRTKARLVVDLLDEVSYDVSWLANPPRLVIELRAKNQLAPDASTTQVAQAAPAQTRPAPAQPAVAAPVDGKVETAQTFEQAFAELSAEPVRNAQARAAASAQARAAQPNPEQPTSAEPDPAPQQAAVITPVTLAPPKAAETNSSGSQSLIRALGLKISRVVIDAGHGGHDPGMVGPSGLQEKDVVLDISTRLARLIEDELGAEVILTRDSDKFIDLQERTRHANDVKADLFISVHANAARTRSVRGVETFYLSLTADSWALSVASRENAASSRSVAELQDLLGKIARKDNLDESRELAGKIQTALHGGLAKQAAAIRNRGVRKAPLLVLMGAKMPAILAEVGFLSNPTDEKLFKTSKHRQYVAEQIFAGVSAYADSLGATQLTMKTPGGPRAQLDD